MSQLTPHLIRCFSVLVQQQIGESNHRDIRTAQHGNDDRVVVRHDAAWPILVRFFKDREGTGRNDAKNNSSLISFVHERLPWVADKDEQERREED
jgi:hypothetical protein